MDREDRQRSADRHRREPLLWALGYETEIAYLIPKAKIEGKGEFENVRLEARTGKREASRQLDVGEQPVHNTPEFRGLKILMVMINNWDMKDDNNEILAMRGDTTGEESYATSSAIWALHLERQAGSSRAAATSRLIT